MAIEWLLKIGSEKELVELTVLMPCHNEVATIRNNIEETLGVLTASNIDSFEIVVIDDGSIDGSMGEIVKVGAKNNTVKYVNYPVNQGKGFALRKGFEKAQGKYVAFLDGDLDLPPTLLVMFLEKMKVESADVVIGSKRHIDSQVNYPLNRRVFSLFYQMFIRVLFDLDIRDTQVGVKLFRREVLDRVFHRSLIKRFAFDVEVLVNANALGYRIIEAPIEMDFISVVSSDVDVQAVVQMFVDTCAIFYRLKILHYYDR